MATDVNVLLFQSVFCFQRIFSPSLPPCLELHSIHQYGESYFRLIWHNRLYLYTAAGLVLGLLFSLKMAVKKVIYPVLVIIRSVIRYCCVCVI